MQFRTFSFFVKCYFNYSDEIPTAKTFFMSFTSSRNLQGHTLIAQPCLMFKQLVKMPLNFTKL